MIDQRLVNYIKLELSKGISLNQIKQKLLSKGWLNYDIDKAINLATQNISSAIPTYNSYKESSPKPHKFWIFFVLIGVFLIAAGIFIYPSLIGEKSNETNLSLIENSTLECKIQSQVTEITLLKGVSGSVSASGFQGGADEVSWKIEDSDVALVNQSSGTLVMVEAKEVGSTKIIITDNALGSDCTTSIDIEVTSIYD